MDQMETTEVVIVGCGPTGAMLSTLLGQYGVRNIVLEREPDITTDPRGIALDEDGIRLLQACGIYDKIFTEIGQCTGSLKFVSGCQKDLYKKEFVRFNYATVSNILVVHGFDQGLNLVQTEGGTGHPGFFFHKQPCIEKHLRARIEELPSSELRVSCSVEAISEDEDFVYVNYTHSSGQSRRVRAQFLVGCDGKTGFTRKRYLEPRGIKLERAHQTSYEEVWVALNWKISLPTQESHPNFPLWKKGYTPQRVYDSFFPVDFRFLCQPSRPAVCGRFGLPEDRLWRFEFVVPKGEDGNEMAKDENIRKIVWPYLTHRASRYGLSGSDISFPQDCVESLRCRPFTFSARSCNKWALDRVILCGDAAHVFPPFGGQGIASGFRDAVALAWRLRLACGSPQLNHKDLLLGWYSERKQSLDRSLASTIENGNYVTNGDPLKAFIRDWSMWLMQLIPSWKHWLELGDRRVGMTKYKWEVGKQMCFMPDMGGGGNFPQVYCRRLDSGGKGKMEVQFTDDVIFSPAKRGLYQLVVLPSTMKELEAVQASLAGIGKDCTSASALIQEATYLLQQTTSSSGTQHQSTFRLATAHEFEHESTLSVGRPKPDGYDPTRMRREVNNALFVLLRPDRFVFASTSRLEDLITAIKHISAWC